MTLDTPNGPADGFKWLSVPLAAQALGCSERTIQRRAQAGKIAARKVSRRDGEAWEIGLGAATGAATPAILPTGVPTGAATVLRVKPEGAAKSGGSVPTGADIGAATLREVELKEEVNFLRGVVEQLQRDAAETRAALRKALEAMPKGLPSPASGNGPESGEKAVDEHIAVGGAKPSQKPANRAESGAATSYGELADWLEKMEGDSG